MQNIVKITKSARATVKPDRRYETHKTTTTGKHTTLARRQVRSIKYGGIV